MRKRRPSLPLATLGIVILAIGIYLFSQLTDQASQVQTTNSTPIPLGNGSFNQPGDIQGSRGLQSAMPIQPNQLNDLNFQ